MNFVYGQRSNGVGAGSSERTARDALAGGRKRSRPAALCACYRGAHSAGRARRWKKTLAARCVVRLLPRSAQRGTRSPVEENARGPLRRAPVTEERTARDALAGGRKRSRPLRCAPV